MGMMSPAQASVAQLDRVLPSEGRGRGFESRRVHHILVSDCLRQSTKQPKKARPVRAFLFLAVYFCPPLYLPSVYPTVFPWSDTVLASLEPDIKEYREQDDINP